MSWEGLWALAVLSWTRLFPTPLQATSPTRGTLDFVTPTSLELLFWPLKCNVW